MCGIFGAFGLDKNLLNQSDEIIRLLRHRGPDDDGCQSFPEGLMAHTRLSIIDLSSQGCQPMANDDRSCWIVFNGEIYNYRELRQELADYPYRTNTDTEIILAAYKCWGDNFIHRLRGMFAFGLWDAREKKLICATDRFSIKPLYYLCINDGVVFSSEVKPFYLCGWSPKVNETNLYDYLAFGLLDHNEDTLFEGVKQLRPGTYFVYKDNRLRLGTYWDLDEDFLKNRPNVKDEFVAAEEKLREAIAIHLRSDVEVGLSLSSGLDSNVLRTLLPLEAKTDRSLKCFTYCFKGTPYDEGEPVRRLLRSTSHRHYSVEVEPRDVPERLDKFIWFMEEPVGGLPIFGYWLNAGLAASEGIKVLLDGQGSDEAFGGYKYYYELKFGQLAQQKKFDELRRELEAFNSIHESAIAFPSPEFDQMLKNVNHGGFVFAPDGTSLASNCINPEFASGFKNRQHHWGNKFSSSVKEAMRRDLLLFKIPKLLRFQDRAAMAWGVEVRVPYLDHEFIELMYSFDENVLLHRGETKFVLRQLARKLMPEYFHDKPKLYVSTPQREWTKGPWSGWILNLLSSSELARAGYVDKEKLVKQYNAYRASKELGNSFFIWKFFNLELWYRAFIKKSPCGPNARLMTVA